MRRLTARPLSFVVSSLLLVGTLGVSGCQTATSSSVDGAAMGELRPIAIRESMSVDAASFRQGGVALFESADEFEPYASGPLADLQVDWSDNDVVVLALGTQPTGGYWASIESAQVEGDTLYVQGTANRPAAGDAVAQAVTYPVAVVVVEKTGAARVVPQVESVTGRSLD